MMLQMKSEMVHQSSGFDAKRSILKHLAFALLLGLMLSAGVGTWAFLTEISGAVVASGRFVVDSNVKKIQHATGGIIDKIYVKDGDKVVSGQRLIHLNDTQIKASRAIIIKRIDELRARLARLQAERDDLDEVGFSRQLLDRLSDPDASAAIRSETQLFEFRANSRSSRKSQLLERIGRFKEEIVGLKAQQQAYEDIFNVLQLEIDALTKLHLKKIISNQRLNALKVQAATSSGNRGEKISQQAQIARQIAEAKLQILDIDKELKAEVAREISEVQSQLGEFLERRIAVDDELRRIDILAPQGGIVHQMSVHTVGGVVQRGEPLLFIVPNADHLAVEVEVSAKDIDRVYNGQKTQIRLPGLDQRTTPQINASVSRVAADVAHDTQTGRDFYIVRLSVGPDELQKLENVTIVSGMPAEALIQTKAHSVWSYLVKPLADQISLTFRE